MSRLVNALKKAQEPEAQEPESTEQENLLESGADSFDGFSILKSKVNRNLIRPITKFRWKVRNLWN